MPKGPRVVITHKEIKYNFSEAQYELLAKGPIKAKDPLKWSTEQRVRSLVERGLLVKRKGAFVRTRLGSAVVDAYNRRTNGHKVAKAAATKE